MTLGGEAVEVVAPGLASIPAELASNQCLLPVFSTMVAEGRLRGLQGSSFAVDARDQDQGGRTAEDGGRRGAEVPEPAAEAPVPGRGAPSHFLTPSADPRRGVLWAGAAPVEAGSGRVGAGVAGAWFGTWTGLQFAGGGAEADAAWAPTRRLALTITGGVATGGVRDGGGFFSLEPASGWATFGSARYLVVEGDRARVAPFVVGGVGTLGDIDPIGVVGGGVAVEVPFYDVVFDLALPVGGAVVTGDLPELVPLAIGDFAPLFLLFEAGFTWRIGPYTTFRLGYLALATSYSWRYRRGPLTVELSGHTNVVTANVSTRVGWAF